MSQTDPRAVAREHYGDPCVYCHTGHDDVAIGQCPRRKSDIVELAKLPNGYWGVLINKVTSFATIDLDAARCNFQRVDEAIAQALADAERVGMERAAKMMCSYCNDPQWPRSAIVQGNAVHIGPITGSLFPCNAMQIHSALRAQVQTDKEE